MSENIKPTKKAMSEAFDLAYEVVKNIELSEFPLENIALKVSRLSRLLNDFLMQEVMKYEVSGYPSTPNGLPEEIYKLAVISGREFEKEDFIERKGATKRYVYPDSIRELETKITSGEVAILSSKNPDIVASTTPYQGLLNKENQNYRVNIRKSMLESSSRLASRKAFIYDYALKIYHELKFSGIADDIFTRIRRRVDDNIGNLLPDSVQRFSAVYGNLQSDNIEDWSNAVHSCRRILQNLADKIFPSTDTKREKNGKSISLGKEQYINRIIAFAEDHSTSDRYKDLVGSNIKFLGERLDSIFQAAQKGSHTDIIKQEEADRYVVYTYLIVGDVLSLWSENSENMHSD